jgi:hypothetical protein
MCETVLEAAFVVLYTTSWVSVCSRVIAVFFIRNNAFILYVFIFKTNYIKDINILKMSSSNMSVINFFDSL